MSTVVRFSFQTSSWSCGVVAVVEVLPDGRIVLSHPQEQACDGEWSSLQELEADVGEFVIRGEVVRTLHGFESRMVELHDAWVYYDPEHPNQITLERVFGSTEKLPDGYHRIRDHHDDEQIAQRTVIIDQTAHDAQVAQRKSFARQCRANLLQMGYSGDVVTRMIDETGPAIAADAGKWVQQNFPAGQPQGLAATLLIAAGSLCLPVTADFRAVLAQSGLSMDLVPDQMEPFGRFCRAAAMAYVNRPTA